MAKLVALNSRSHLNIRVDTSRIEEVGADLNMVPVYVSEFLKLVVHYPILFSKNFETGQFVCIALLGFEEGQNLFWQNAKWHSIYTPLSITRHPFFVSENDASNADYIVCIDMDNHAVNETHGERLFENNGKATHFLELAQSSLIELVKGEKQTAELIEVLLTLELMLPLSLEITFNNGDNKNIKGLYSVDEDKLANLSSDGFETLRNSGFIQAVYTQVASLGQIYALINNQNLRNEQTSPWLRESGE